MIETIAGQVRIPLGSSLPTLPDGGELIFEPLDWGNDRVHMIIRAYGAPGRFGDPGRDSQDHSVVISLSALQTIVDHFKETA